MPPHVLSQFAHGLLMGKILAACPVTIPVKLNNDDKFHNFMGVIDDIDKSIKSTARTITRTKLSDKIRSENVLHKANLKCLNESVASIIALTAWKSKKSMDPLGCYLSKERKCTSNMVLRSNSSNEIHTPVPGYPTMAANVMARVWNSVPDLKEASSVYAAKTASRKWAKTIPR